MSTALYLALAAPLMLALAAATGLRAAPLGEILDRNELVMCAQAHALPFSRQDGTLEGFQIELGRALAAELGVALRVHFMHLHREPRRKECDALMSVAVPREADADVDYRTSDPYMAYRAVLVVHRSRSAVRALTDFAPGRVAVPSGSWAHFLLTGQNVPVWVRFRTDEEIIGAVESGASEAGIVSNFGYGWYRQRHPEAAVREAVEHALDGDLGFDVAVGLMDADQALVDRVNAALERMAESGVISATLARYGIALEPPARAAGR
jgi:polar amino acid transport system substrate-binding protein